MSRAFSHKTGARRLAHAMEARGMTDKCPGMGRLERLARGFRQGHDRPHRDWARAAGSPISPPYGVVGPFSLDELEREGRVAFGACFVMSLQRWNEDQVELRLEAAGSAPPSRRFSISTRTMIRSTARCWICRSRARSSPSEIRAAFRRMAKTAHPDAGGSDEHYRRIAEARDALLEQFAGAS